MFLRCACQLEKWRGCHPGHKAAWAGKLALGIALPFLAAAQPLQAQSQAVGQTPGMTLASQAQTGDYLLGTIQVSSSFSDNVLLSSTHGISDVDYGIQPAATLSKTVDWLHMLLEFNPSLVKYQRIDQRDRLTGSVVTDFNAKPLERWTIDLNNNYRVRTNPPFDTFAPEQTTSSYTGEGGGTIIPLVNETSDDGDLNVTYQPAARTTLQASMFFREYMYHPIPGETETEGLVNSQSEVGRLQFYREFSPRFLMGASYSLQNIDFSFSNHSAGVLANNFVGVGTFKFTPALQLQVFGGPVLAHTHNQILLNLGIAAIYLPVTSNTLSYTGGGIFALHKDRTTMQLIATREVSGGSGFTGAAQSDKAEMSIRREFSAHWFGEISGQYALFTPIGPTNNAGFDIHIRSGKAALNRKLSQNFSVAFQISRGQQLQITQGTRRYVDVDFAMITLKYQIKHPIG